MSYFTNWTIRHGKTIVIKTSNNLAYTDLYAYTTSDSQLDNYFIISWTWPILRHSPTDLNKQCIPIRLLSVCVSRLLVLCVCIGDIFNDHIRSLALSEWLSFAYFYLFEFFFGWLVQFSLSGVLCYRSCSLSLLRWATCRKLPCCSGTYFVVYCLSKTNLNY